MTMGKASKDINTILSSASKLASYSILLQLSFRVLTFLLNAFILRYVTKEVLGIVNVRLLLMYSTILFMSREAFRRACLNMDDDGKGIKQASDKAVRWTQTINLLWCMIPIGLLFTTLITYCWIYLLEAPDPFVIPNYWLAAIVYGFCAWIELFVEPLWIIGQSFLFVRLKVVSEGLAIIVKCIVTVIFVVYFPHWGLISFCFSMVSFSLVYIVIYYGYFIWLIKSGGMKQVDDFPIRYIRDLFPKYTITANLINLNSAKLTWSFSKQSILKQILTEGERYVMTVLNVLSFADQGVYDIINNLGSLVARFVFLPIEESFYLFFAKTLKRGVPARQQTPEEIKAISRVLFCLLRLVVLIGLTIVTFGLPYSLLLLDIYGGDILSSGTGPLLLKAYCFYVLVIAVNGTTECFVFASMSQYEVDRYNKKMLIFSFLFLTSSYYLTTSIGSVGFILANCLNMLARIIHSIIYIRRFYESSDFASPLIGLIPSKSVLSSLIVSSLICSHAERQFCCDKGWLLRFTHIGVGASCLTLVVILMWFSERELIIFLREQYFSKPKHAEKCK